MNTSTNWIYAEPRHLIPDFSPPYEGFFGINDTDDDTPGYFGDFDFCVLLIVVLYLGFLMYCAIDAVLGKLLPFC